MKTHIMFLLLAMLTWQCFQPTASAQIPNSGFSKKIKTIESYRVNSPSGDKIHESSEHFDKDGKLIKRLTYNSYLSGGTDEMNCTYDAQGNSKCITKDESGKKIYFYENKYEGENVVEEKSTYETIKYSYDKNGNVLLQEKYDNEGNFSNAEKYELEYLDGTTNLKSKTTFEKRKDGDFKIYGEDKYTYNKNGKLATELARTNFYEYRYTYIYYPNGNLKEKTTENGDSEKIITKYHENGKRRIEAIFRSEGPTFPMELDQKNKWTYDEQDNEILAEHIRNEKLVSKRITE
ncbi:MAG: hypothetical protein AB8F94_24795, partial [Saprospiraceae bacterium]